jgi:hypothetical protein
MTAVSIVLTASAQLRPQRCIDGVDDLCNTGPVSDQVKGVSGEHERPELTAELTAELARIASDPDVVREGGPLR